MSAARIFGMMFAAWLNGQTYRILGGLAKRLGRVLTVSNTDNVVTLVETRFLGASGRRNEEIRVLGR